MLVAVEYYSKWPEIFTMEIIYGIRVAEIFRRMFARLGIPRMVISDNGKQFISKEVKEIFTKLGVEHHTVALYAQAQKGLADDSTESSGEN